MKRTLSLFLSLLMLLPLLASCGRQKLDEPIEFIIANDIHYISPFLLGENGYDAEGVSFSRDGKLVHYISDITDAFIAEVIEKKPRALILAGDLTMNGAVVSHEELVAKLTAVKDAGIDILAIPGNHDIDKTAVDYSGDELKEAEAADSAKFIELYEPLLPEDISRDRTSMSCIYKASDKLWVLMLDTNTYGQCYVKDTTLAWIEEELKKAQEEKADVIAVSHQNLYAHSDMLSFGYQLYNASDLLGLYEKYSVIANFSGHIHIQSIVDEEIPEIATSSAAITGTHYGRIVYNGKQIEYSAESVNVSAYAQSIGSEDENLLDFENYAKKFFEDIALLHSKNSLADSGLSEADISLMAETYANINSAYFEGRPIDTSAYAAGIDLWHTQSGSFTAYYIDSMIGYVGNDQRSITIKLK